MNSSTLANNNNGEQKKIQLDPHAHANKTLTSFVLAEAFVNGNASATVFDALNVTKSHAQRMIDGSAEWTVEHLYAAARLLNKPTAELAEVWSNALANARGEV